ncbi:hypothetical protein KCU77_g1686, partial [Aureobasidium melanogenum]
MLSNTNIPDLETLLRKDLVDRPVNALFIEHNYTDLELGTLNSLEPDASKAIGRQLSDTERNVLLEYKGNSIASDSRPSAFTVTTAALGGLLSIMFMTEIRHLSLRDLGGIAFVVFQTALLFKPAESQLLSLRILSDPRMSEFKESIQRRKKDFGGHEPEIVRRKDRNIVPPIQWFRDVCWSNYIASIKCRQREVSELFQTLELGLKPGRPDAVTGLISNGNMTVTVSAHGKTISFTPTITYPPNGTAPYPAIIAFGALTIPAPSGVVIITYNNEDIAAQNNQNSRGQGKFFELYPDLTADGAMTAWAWGVSRILDVLETLSDTNIDPKKVTVTGCSRNGKGALVAGALDSRITLTIPQESGSGGTACWRLSDYENHNGTTQTASEIVQENVWFATQFDEFANTTVDTLPFDHHMLAGLVAPRGFLVIDNIGYEWLGPWSSFGCMKTARRIYQALGALDHLGYSMSPSHLHCSFPSYQAPQLQAFVDRFLFDKASDTDFFVPAGNITFDDAQWVDWSTPKLL